jgi:hypothetical protein
MTARVTWVLIVKELVRLGSNSMAAARGNVFQENVVIDGLARVRNFMVVSHVRLVHYRTGRAAWKSRPVSQSARFGVGGVA